MALNPALFFDFANQDVTGDYYVFRRNTVAQESERATAARGTSSSLGYSRENIQGKGYQIIVHVRREVTTLISSSHLHVMRQVLIMERFSITRLLMVKP